MNDPIDPAIVEMAARAGFAAAAANAVRVYGLGKPVTWDEYLTDADRKHELIRTRAALSAAAPPIIAAKALREAADDIDKEEAEEAAKVRQGNVRCLVCELEWNQRGHFGCHGNYHEFDGADFSRAGEVRIEETYAGQFLRTRADQIAGQS